MDSFSLNSAKSYLGKNVNLHLKDGSVIINVQVVDLPRGGLQKSSYVEFVPYGKTKTTRIPIRHVAWAELLNPSLLDVAALKRLSQLKKAEIPA
jgi:hypothetical protein